MRTLKTLQYGTSERILFTVASITTSWPSKINSCMQFTVHMSAIRIIFTTDIYDSSVKKDNTFCIPLRVR